MIISLNYGMPFEKSSDRRQPPRRNTFFLTFFGLAYRQRIESLVMSMKFVCLMFVLFLAEQMKQSATNSFA